MGTSKSYITPKTQQNTAVKRGITSNLCGGGVSTQEVISRFAKAIISENSTGTGQGQGQGTSTGSFNHYGKQVGKVLEFISGVSALGGIANAIALRYPDNPPQNPHELFSHLLNEDAAVGTLDSAVVAKAFSLTIEKLEIVDLEQLNVFDFPAFTKELLANLAMTCFEQRYAAQIQSKASTLVQAGTKLEEFKRYIYNEIIANSDTNEINQHIANNDDLSVYIEFQCKAIFSILKSYI